MGYTINIAIQTTVLSILSEINFKNNTFGWDFLISKDLSLFHVVRDDVTFFGMKIYYDTAHYQLRTEVPTKIQRSIMN